MVGCGCHGKSRRSRNGEVGHGMVLWGVASRGGRGMVRSVKERRVEAVMARLRLVGSVVFGRVKAVAARSVKVRWVKARFG